jgi:polar amino acid transport system substrate-binding protein
MKGWLTATLAVLLVACGLPRDPEGTLRRVEGGIVRVGVTENPPWTSVDDGGGVAGVEVGLVRSFARDLDARVEWVTGSEAELFAALETHALDLLVGGLTTDNPWTQEAAVTRPYITTRIVIATPDGTLPHEDIAGMAVSVEKGSHAAGLLAKSTAIPVPVDDILSVTGPAAVEDWLLDDLRLMDTGVHLSEAEHVMAVPGGENGWLVALERFLFRQRPQIRTAVRASGSP